MKSHTIIVDGKELVIDFDEEGMKVNDIIVCRKETTDEFTKDEELFDMRCKIILGGIIFSIMMFQ
jgi:hypothetical protein